MKLIAIIFVTFVAGSAWAEQSVGSPVGKVDLKKTFGGAQTVKVLSKEEMKITKGAGECMTFFFDNGGHAEAFQLCW